MLIPDLRHAQRLFEITQTTVRRIHDDVLPRSQRRLNLSGVSLNKANTCQVESTQRLLDGDGD